ncbi:MAG: peptidylprolyl isomerase [Pedobacter sp.]|nr:MAG: peptidylprolyl isomerase [Pedobacter sp.]
MGIMTFLRNRAGYILVGAIGFAIVAFLVGDAVSVGSPFWEESRRSVGSIDGEDISIEDFTPKVDQSLAQFKQQYGTSNAQMQAMAVDNVWNGEVANVLLSKEYARLGLTVSGEELFDLLQGNDPSPLIRQYFGDPKTGDVDRNAVVANLKQAESNPELKKNWDMLQNEIEKQALQQKYTKLISNSVYVTSLEANDEYMSRNKLASFNYINLDYMSVNDKDVKLTDADYTDYYNKNKARFNNPTELRSFEFVSFTSQPSKEDSLAVKNNIEKLAADFKTAANDSLFAAVNSDVKVPYVYLSKGKLDPSVDSVIFNYPAGSFYGPKFSGSSYKLVKVVGSKFSPDSVKASHILIDAAKVGGLDKAKKMADSLKTVIENGGNFTMLAQMYSSDGSKSQGGDLGTFGRGAMVPEFENAAFNNKTGDVVVATSQFGVHVIKVVKQIGSSKVIKVAYIEKGLGASSKTQSIAYKKATAFFGEVNSENFKALAQKRGYKVESAERVTATQGYAPGLDNPRQLIRNAYEADKGEMLPQVYQMDDNGYVVARLTEIRPKGTLPLDLVKKEIEPMVRNSVKAKMLIEKMNAASAGASNIAQVAQKIGKSVVPVQNVVFANPVIPGVAQENAVIGTVFGSQVNKISKPIEGDKGVYMIAVTGFVAPAPMSNTFKQKESMLSGLSQRSLGAAFQALQDKSKIKDNRVKFY